MPSKSSHPSSESGNRERILTTATTLFSERGYDGVSVNDIVASAGLSKRMVYHYFANKAGLYQETLYFAYRELGEFEAAQLAGTDSLETIVQHLIQTYFKFPQIHPEFTQLIMWENLSKGKHIKNTKSRLSKKTVIDHLQAAINREADGVRWRKDLEARQLFITILGLCQVYSYHRYTLSQALELDLGSPHALKSGMANAERFVLAGMRPEPASPAKSRGKKRQSAG